MEMQPILLDTKDLMKLLQCSYKYAVEIGTAAQAAFKVGTKPRWYLDKVKRYIEENCS